MYSVQFSDWGLVLDFMGKIQQDVASDWLADVRQLQEGLSEPFGVILDLRGARPAAPNVEARLRQGLLVLQQAGVERVAVIVDEITGVRWARVVAADELKGVRRISAQSADEGRVEARAWVQNGIEPWSTAASKREKKA